MIHETQISVTAVVSALFTVLCVAVVMDIRSHRIPNLLLAPALSFALLLHTVVSGPMGLLAAVGGLGVGLAMLMPLYALGGMGAGDVKLLGVVGSFLGPWGALVAGAGTMMAGAVFGLAYIFANRTWPLVQAYANSLLVSHDFAQAAANTENVKHRAAEPTRFAYAPAIAAGTLAALWYIDYLSFLKS